MASVTGICNRGLQLLGAARILNIVDSTRNGRACNACYDDTRRSELRKHRWRFAINRALLSPLVWADPLGKFLYAFQLPADCLKVLMPESDTFCDWQIENKRILTNSTQSLNLRYIMDIADPNIMDENFREMLSCKMAEIMCEEITQSNTKKADVKMSYKEARDEARKSNAFETIPAEPETDTWLIARL